MSITLLSPSAANHLASAAVDRRVIGPYSTLATAVEAAEKESFSAAILDVRLGLSDTTVSVASLLAGRHIPFLFYTGQTLPPSMQTHLPDAAVLAKPAPPAELVASVSRLLDRPRRP
ncbi:MAG: hypothetical protein ACRC67_31245 [Inquilinus sp.]|uniref:hypothetical protein n=1 Tax=Inquilinus sp. TaxID=1932117 RepID=UPI003F3CA03C